METLDARGRACPEPVLMTRGALSRDASGVVVRVDELCAKENIARFAQNAGYRLDSRSEGEEWTLTLTKG